MRDRAKRPVGFGYRNARVVMYGLAGASFDVSPWPASTIDGWDVSIAGVPADTPVAPPLAALEDDGPVLSRERAVEVG